LLVFQVKFQSFISNNKKKRTSKSPLFSKVQERYATVSSMTTWHSVRKLLK